ncbi:NAD(P)-binding protein [Phialemonium atrogriseum]|uniref:NAD(P)-binding protein n=1 Tax=Phialemonium atrogriseum TaxID=1093897 RepID=A0AAJ0BTZ6_9PEZI|nr:NAD(P)-binding protein [Phialemonium atrogriseum]KAK1764191.1 NAD(P)-binding protein [Phialemonium atrogriseum]
MAPGPDTLSLSGKIAIVTGSGRENGIGAAIAYALGRNGASVAINYVSDSSADRATVVANKVKSLGGNAIIVQADVETVEGAEKLIRDTLEGFVTDRIDILINNAGFGAGQGIPATEISAADAEKNFRSNALSSLYVTQAAAKHIPQGGRIINIGSVVSRLVNLPGVSAYGASKAAQDYFTASWAYELGRSKGVTVNTVAPGPTKTDAGTWYPAGEFQRICGANILAQSKIEERAGQPEEVADVVLLLTSEQARWITGQYIAASGGISW